MSLIYARSESCQRISNRSLTWNKAWPEMAACPTWRSPRSISKNPPGFYKEVLGWKIQNRGVGDVRFEDATGHLIGKWVTSRPSSYESGFLPYFYVNDVDFAMETMEANGGEVVKPPYAEGSLWIAIVRDPAGNRMGVWQ